jgi:hypothetical protein
MGNRCKPLSDVNDQRNKLSPITKPDDNDVQHDGLTTIALAELEDRLKAHLRELDARLTARLDDIEEKNSTETATQGAT